MGSGLNKAGPENEYRPRVKRQNKLVSNTGENGTRSRHHRAGGAAACSLGGPRRI